MTDKEIIKALECCAEDEWCCNNNCPFFEKCSKTLMAKSSLDIINRQQAEIEDLQMDKEQLKRAVINANMKGEHLQAKNKRLLTEFLRFKEEIAQPYLLINCDDKSVEVLRERLKNQKLISVPYNEATVEFLDKASIRAEAVKEFAERLKKESFEDAGYYDNLVFVTDIDNLVKEMAGEN